MLVRCPFYKFDDGKRRITCEGIIEGSSLQQNTTIKPLVRLRPYRTFQEVEQPEGLFLIRIDERGISFIEADGGMWKLKARETIKAYLEEHLAQEIENGSVIVML